MPTDRRAKRVWERLIQAYGSRVAEMYGADVPPPWVDAIEDLTDDQIAYGLRAVSRESVNHPPTLGMFMRCCNDAPLNQGEKGPTTQELLCTFTTLKYHGKIEPDIFSLPWVYLYKQWIDEDKPKHLQRCAECTGLLIEDVDGNSLIRVNVIDMQADPQLHAKALRSFKPFEHPSRNIPTLTGLRT